MKRLLCDYLEEFPDGNYDNDQEKHDLAMTLMINEMALTLEKLEERVGKLEEPKCSSSCWQDYDMHVKNCPFTPKTHENAGGAKNLTNPPMTNFKTISEIAEDFIFPYLHPPLIDLNGEEYLNQVALSKLKSALDQAHALGKKEGLKAAKEVLYERDHDPLTMDALNKLINSL